MRVDGAPASGRDGSFRPRCLSIDLEVSRNGVIHALGAVRADTDESLTHAGGGLTAALYRLDALADGASFILGHNLIAFDLPHLTAAKPDLRLLKLPVVDTLRLSPLAFPRNPYHPWSSTTRTADSSAGGSTTRSSTPASRWKSSPSSAERFGRRCRICWRHGIG